MRKMYFILLFMSGLPFVKAQNINSNKNQKNSFTSIQIDTLFEDKISIRAIVIENNKVWYAGNKNRYGYFDLVSSKKFENTILHDTLQIEFRSIAKTKKYIYVLSVANPALLYQISKDGKFNKLVYQEQNDKVFYDSMQFWNENEGIAIGDPITNCLSIITTVDGGETWEKLPDSLAPKVFEGEAHFAASNTNIIVKKNHTWIVSGGKKARIFYSPNKGKSWEVNETPIIQGKQMTGIFTADFYDDKRGIVAGGNYEVLNQNTQNKAITKDGGKSWDLIANGEAFGYASCVQYVPNSKGNGIVVVGASGIYYSSDAGLKWIQLSADPNLYTIRFLTNTVAIAAGRNKMIRIKFK